MSPLRGSPTLLFARYPNALPYGVKIFPPRDMGYKDLFRETIGEIVGNFPPKKSVLNLKI